MRAKLDIKEQTCQHCGTTLELFIESVETTSAIILEQKDEETIPTFEIELGDSEIKFEPYFKCPKCNTKSYEANRDIAFDDTQEILIFPAYDPDSKTGFKVPVYPSYQAQQPTMPKEEPQLPTIKRASAGEEIVKKITDIEEDYIMWMGGSD